AALLLLRGASDSDVARQVGVDRMTIARWRKTPSFRRVFEAQRSTVWRNSVARLHELIDPALDILEKQLSAGDARTAMRAASILLRLVGPARVPRVSLDADDEDPDEPVHTTAAAKQQDRAFWDEMEAYINAPLPGEPGAP